MPHQYGMLVVLRVPRNDLQIETVVGVPKFLNKRRISPAQSIQQQCRSPSPVSLFVLPKLARCCSALLVKGLLQFLAKQESRKARDFVQQPHEVPTDSHCACTHYRVQLINSLPPPPASVATEVATPRGACMASLLA